MPSNGLILCRPILLMPSVFSSIRVFSNESALHQSIGVSASASLLPVNIQDWFPLGLTDLISLLSEGLSRASSNTTKSINSSVRSFLYGPTLTSIHDRWKNHSFDYMVKPYFVSKVMSLLFNMLSGLVIAFLPRSKRLLISWLWSPSAVIFEPK